MCVGDSAVVGADRQVEITLPGYGSFKVRGNVYVTGDLVYADAEASGARTYGHAADGSKNLLTIAARRTLRGHNAPASFISLCACSMAKLIHSNVSDASG